MVFAHSFDVARWHAEHQDLNAGTTTVKVQVEIPV